MAQVTTPMLIQMHGNASYNMLVRGHSNDGNGVTFVADNDSTWQATSSLDIDHGDSTVGSGGSATM